MSWKASEISQLISRLINQLVAFSLANTDILCHETLTMLANSYSMCDNGLTVSNH